MSGAAISATLIFTDVMAALDPEPDVDLKMQGACSDW
jgi:hypothetical protein